MQPMYYIGLEGSSCGRKVASSLVIPLYRYVASTYPFCLHLLRKLPGWVPVIPILKLIRKEPSMTQKTESAVLSPNLAPHIASIARLPDAPFAAWPSPIPPPASVSSMPQHKKDRDAANVADRLIGDTQEFTSAVTINHLLGELYKLLARDEIAPRLAAVMAYTCNLLFHTLPAIERELHRSDEKGPTIVMDIDCAVARRAAEAQQAESTLHYKVLDRGR
jgi:hypothetical protein